MSGGQTILWGLLVLLVVLIWIVKGVGASMVTLILGGVPLVVLAVGVVLTAMGVSELRSRKAKPSPAEGA